MGLATKLVMVQCGKEVVFGRENFVLYSGVGKSEAVGLEAEGI